MSIILLPMDNKMTVASPGWARRTSRGLFELVEITVALVKVEKEFAKLAVIKTFKQF
jgi:hypothetical protein